MKANFKFLFIMVFFYSAFAKAQLRPATCYFVNAQSGLNLRSGPGTHYDVIQKLLYGSQLKVVEKVPSTSKTHIIDDGVKKYGQWVLVEPTFLYDYDQKMYVFDVFFFVRLSNQEPK